MATHSQSRQGRNRSGQQTAVPTVNIKSASISAAICIAIGISLLVIKDSLDNRPGLFGSRDNPFNSQSTPSTDGSRYPHTELTDPPLATPGSISPEEQRLLNTVNSTKKEERITPTSNGVAQPYPGQQESLIAAEAARIHEEYARRLVEEQRKHAQKLSELQHKMEQERSQLESELTQAQQLVQSYRDAEADEAASRKEEARLAAAELARRERDALEADFRAAANDIRRYLTPFTTPGCQQLEHRRWVSSDKPVPVSLSGIRDNRCLENTQLGYQQLYWIGGGQCNDRPNGIFRHYIGGAIHHPETQTVRKVQVLLDKFGDLMVEKGMLAP